MASSHFTVGLLLLCPRRILSPTLEELKQLQLEQKTEAAAVAAVEMEQDQQQQQQHAANTCAPATSSKQPAANHHAAAPAMPPSRKAAAAAGEGTCSVPSLQAATAPRAAMAAVFAPLSAAHVAYRQRLDEEERRSARINMLLRKDFLHRMLFTGYVYGTCWPLTAAALSTLSCSRCVQCSHKCCVKAHALSSVNARQHWL
jgi:hypothetical protein